MPVERLEIVAALHDERVDRVVAMATGLSRTAAAQLVAAGRVRVADTADTAVTARAARVAAGQVLVIDWDLAPVASGVEADTAVAVRVVHADDHLIVVDKPAGLVVHPGNGKGGGTLVNGLLALFPELAGVGEDHRPGVVHRLDRGTSGLLVVARTAVAYEALVAALGQRRVGRRYACLVAGRPAAAAGVIDAPIGRSRHDATRRAVVEDGKAARTGFSVARTFDQPVALALLRCELETGRTHQIRVHLQAVGLPVVGDDVYGGAGLRLGLRRPFLHAAELRLDHPVTGRPLTFESPLPADLAAVLADLEERAAAAGTVSAGTVSGGVEGSPRPRSGAS